MWGRDTDQGPSPERQILNLVTQLNGSAAAGLRNLSSPSVAAAELWPRGPHYVHPPSIPHHTLFPPYPPSEEPSLTTGPFCRD